MNADEIGLTLVKGTTFRQRFRFVTRDPDDDTVLLPVDLTGYTFRFQIRATPDAPTVILSLTSDPPDGITVETAAGAITLSATDETTSALVGRRGVWAVEREIGGEVDRPLSGCATLIPEIVRDEGTS